MQTNELTDRDLIESLRGEVCPACGQRKDRGKTFCGKDYFALPRPKRVALYRRVGDGYLESVQAAMQFFGAAEFRMPEEAKP